jgi:hypothetical protein
MVISPTLDFSRAISSSRSSRSRSFRAVAAPASARSRHSVSLAIETSVGASWPVRFADAEEVQRDRPKRSEPAYITVAGVRSAGEAG